VLTSRHEVDKTQYWVDVERWRSIYAHYCYATKFSDVCIVDFRDLVLEVEAVQRRLTQLVGWTPACDFAEFHRRVPENFDTRALNGVRRLDTNALDRWRDPSHDARLKSLLREMPELPERLVEMGYEVDDQWTLRYR
jgi:hypothetical protein